MFCSGRDADQYPLNKSEEGVGRFTPQGELVDLPGMDGYTRMIVVQEKNDVVAR